MDQKPGCGAKVVAALLLAVGIGYVASREPAAPKLNSDPEPKEAAEAQRTPPGPKWYTGGTLHDATGAEWKRATPENRLATCADFAAKMWEAGHLKQSFGKLESMDDLLAPSLALRKALDEYYAARAEYDAGDDEPVNKVTPSLVAMMGWLPKTP
jgi:hypothetical protein